MKRVFLFFTVIIGIMSACSVTPSVTPSKSNNLKDSNSFHAKEPSPSQIIETSTIDLFDEKKAYENLINLGL